MEIPLVRRRGDLSQPERRRRRRICAAQKSLWDEHVAQPGPDTDTLVGAFRDGVHFNARGLQAHGKLWAEKVENYIELHHQIMPREGASTKP